MTIYLTFVAASLLAFSLPWTCGLCRVFVSVSRQFAKLTLACAINVTAFGFAQKNYPEAVKGNHEVIICD